MRPFYQNLRPQRKVFFLLVRNKNNNNKIFQIIYESQLYILKFQEIYKIIIKILFLKEIKVFCLKQENFKNFVLSSMHLYA